MKIIEDRVTTLWLSAEELVGTERGDSIASEARAAALFDLQRAADRGFAGCDAVFVDGAYDGLHERGERDNGSTDWGRGQRVSERNFFRDGKLVPDSDFVPAPPEAAWESHGFKCRVILTDMGHRCGYVGVPPGHPWHGKEYGACLVGETCPEKPTDPDDWWYCSHRPDTMVDVHGGITFSGAFRGKDDAWYFGFDCAHLGDARSPEATEDHERRHGYVYWERDGHYWLLDEVRAETDRMAAQIAKATTQPGGAE